jgi:hypothetical protein
MGEQDTARSTLFLRKKPVKADQVVDTKAARSSLGLLLQTHLSSTTTEHDDVQKAQIANIHLFLYSNALARAKNYKATSLKVTVHEDRERCNRIACSDVRCNLVCRCSASNLEPIGNTFVAQ